MSFLLPFSPRDVIKQAHGIGPEKIFFFQTKFDERGGRSHRGQGYRGGRGRGRGYGYGQGQTGQ
jgi:hypothetical protein